MAPLNLIGRGPDEIAVMLRRKERAELVEIIVSLASLEPFFPPEYIAKQRGISARKIVALMKDGTIRAHLVTYNRWRAPLSAIAEWDRNTALNP